MHKKYLLEVYPYQKNIVAHPSSSENVEKNNGKEIDYNNKNFDTVKGILPVM